MQASECRHASRFIVWPSTLLCVTLKGGRPGGGYDEGTLRAVMMMEHRTGGRRTQPQAAPGTDGTQPFCALSATTGSAPAH